jgi:hypothetical protein
MFMRRLFCSSWFLSGTSLISAFRFMFTKVFVYSLLAAERHAYFRTFILASVAGIFSLFPLLFTPAGTTFTAH